VKFRKNRLARIKEPDSIKMMNVENICEPVFSFPESGDVNGNFLSLLRLVFEGSYLFYVLEQIE
jgi:hypothetical protein